MKDLYYLIENPKMTHLDRLSSLLSHFEVRSQRMPTAEGSNLFITGEVDRLKKLALYLDADPDADQYAQAIAFAKVDIGGVANPLHQAMPRCLEIDLDEDSDVKTIANLIAKEATTPRCGGRFALDRLCDLLVLSTLRYRIEHQESEPGMFAGLVHPKLSRVIVAIHDDPGHAWQIEDFVQLAGMSRSQFMATFQKVVGKTPIAYLKLWRMTAARVAVLKGERIKEIARRFGYGSGDAFCRAFVNTYGVAPTKIDVDRSAQAPSRPQIKTVPMTGNLATN